MKNHKPMRSRYPSRIPSVTCDAMGWREKLRASRERAGLSLEEMGKRIGMSGQAIQLWEAGPSFPSIPKLLLAAEKVGIDLGWVFSDAPDQFPSDAERAARELFEAKLRAEGARAVLDLLISLHAQSAGPRPLAPANLTLTTVSDPRPPRARRRRRPSTGPGAAEASASDKDLHGQDEGADR